MGCCNAAYLISTITFNTTIKLDCPISFSVIEEVNLLAIRSGVILGPGCRPMISKDVAAVVECLDLLNSPIAGDGPHPLVITLLQAGGGNTVITCTNMLRGTTTWAGTTHPFSRQISFQVEDPLTVSSISVTV